MTAAKKFTFDTVFDGAAPLPAAVQAEEAEAKKAAEEAAPAPPTFSEAELAAARAEAHAQGREEGLKEQADAIERRIMELLDAVNTRLGELFAMEIAAGEDRTRNAVGVAVTIVRKMFPHLQDQWGLKEVEDLVTRTLSEIAEEPKVTVTVHPDAIDALKARIDAIATETRFEGEIDIQTDDLLDPSDCRMAWSRGGVEREAAALWQHIDEIIEKNLGATSAVSQTIEAGPAPTSEETEETEETTETETAAEPAAETAAPAEDPGAAPNAGDDHG